jgi:(S)-mandelate dehydrogenase
VKHNHTIDDLRVSARRRLPRAVFDFMDGAAEDETTLARNRADLEELRFNPRVMVDVSKRDLSTAILGQSVPLPMAIGPTGLAALVWPNADIALARAAQKAGIPFTISAASSVRIEDIAAAVPGARLWFQVYMFKDRDLVRRLIERSRAVGVEALVLTADVPVLGQRERDMRNGFRVPLEPNVRLIYDLMRCPGWSLDILRHGVPKMRNFVDAGRDTVESLAKLMTGNMDASVDWDSAAWLRDIWPGKILLKGVLTPEDATEAVRRGYDAVIVSNHGGRQLEGAPSTISVLPSIADAVGGKVEIYLDSGIRRGASIAKAVASGARGVLLGRATLYGAAAGGEAGAGHALSILRAELDRTLALVGCPSVKGLDRSFLLPGQW